MKNKKIILAGGTGFIGQELARYFGKDNHVVILTRKSVQSKNNRYSKKLLTAADGYNITYWRWDGRHVEKHWAQEIDGSDIVINLAGKSVNCRYNQQNMQRIISSRVLATRVLGEAINQATKPPALMINAASATIYRHAQDRPQDEYNGEIDTSKDGNMPYSFFDRCRRRWQKSVTAIRHGKDSAAYKNLDLDFSVQVCVAWEKAMTELTLPNTRKIIFRTAITLGKGGVMTPYYNLVKWGLGGQHGSGDQLFSWVHIQDVCGAIEWSYDHQEMEGVYNLSAPYAIPNMAFMAMLRRITGHTTGLPAFKWMLECGAALIGTETELMLKSRWVYPTRLLESGFRFRYEHIEDALRNIVQQTPQWNCHKCIQTKVAANL
ncbi:MAG: epimerase [Pseudobacter sp.]|uniref:epimerase n=1 Tax=Pseudobacter sp. TaxID=2045420 RepID=UPI003F7EFEC3